MYLEKITKLLAPVTSTVYDKVAMSFPIPTAKGTCVLYYGLEDNSHNHLKMIDIITIATVNANRYTTITVNDIFTDYFIKDLQTSGATASFIEVFQQRKKCDNALDELIDGTEYETQGFRTLEAVAKDKIKQFTVEIMVYASMLGLETIYAELLSDLYQLTD